jgi:hypothetical protein
VSGGWWPVSGGCDRWLVSGRWCRPDVVRHQG